MVVVLDLGGGRVQGKGKDTPTVTARKQVQPRQLARRRTQTHPLEGTKIKMITTACTRILCGIDPFVDAQGKGPPCEGSLCTELAEAAFPTPMMHEDLESKKKAYGRPPPPYLGDSSAELLVRSAGPGTKVGGDVVEREGGAGLPEIHVGRLDTHIFHVPLAHALVQGFQHLRFRLEFLVIG